VAQEGLKDIVDYRPNPAGLIATSYMNPLSHNDSYPVCVHGGWTECGLQAYQLCVLNTTGDPWALKRVFDCHLSQFQHGPKSQLNITAECAVKLHLDHEKLQLCSQGIDATLLLQSMFLKAAHRGIIGTPSIFVDGKIAVGWYENRTALLKQVCEAYRGPPPRGCQADHGVDDVPGAAGKISVCPLSGKTNVLR